MDAYGDEGGNGKGEIEKQPFPLYYYCLTLLPNHSDLISSPSPSLGFSGFGFGGKRQN